MLAVTERECGSVGPASPHLGAAQGIRRCFQTYCGPFAPSKLGLFFSFSFPLLSFVPSDLERVG